MVRGNKMMGVKNYSMSDAGLDTQQTISSFLSQYYSLNNQLPDEILLNFDMDTSALKEYLYAIKGGAVAINVPKRGIKKRLVDMAEKNATQHLESSVEKLKRKQEMTIGASERLKQILGLKVLRRIECYDVSNISGVDKVASGVVFIDGQPQKKEYRRYKIRTVQGADDFASLQEVLRRRLGGDNPIPDLLAIDGGKGQLSAAIEVLRQMDKDVPVISLAEKQELIFTPNQDQPISLSKSDNALKLLQRLRDEAHRFALSYHRTVRSRSLDSELLSISGVGPKKRERLLKHLTYKEIKTLGANEISQKSGIDLKTAKNIQEFYKENSNS